jgi:ATPase complex subunit ATP10
LVAISFRNSGYKLIPSWTDPFLKAFEGKSRAQVVKVSITERWSLYPLQGMLARIMRGNTPPEEHDKTLLYFGTNVDEFRDVIRMHNIMTNYIFLVDDLGRIRFAGSGEATDEEVARVVGFAKELTAVRKRKGRKSTRRSSKQTKQNIR